MNVVFLCVPLDLCKLCAHTFIHRILTLAAGWLACAVFCSNGKPWVEVRGKRRKTRGKRGLWSFCWIFILLFFRIYPNSKRFFTMKKKHFNGYCRSKQYFIIFQDLWEFKFGGFDNVEEVRRFLKKKQECLLFLGIFLHVYFSQLFVPRKRSRHSMAWGGTLHLINTRHQPPPMRESRSIFLLILLWNVCYIILSFLRRYPCHLCVALNFNPCWKSFFFCMEVHQQ